MLSTYTVTILASDYSAGTLLSEITDAPAGPHANVTLEADIDLIIQ